jgi:hypothetical protein
MEEALIINQNGDVKRGGRQPNAALISGFYKVFIEDR